MKKLAALLSILISAQAFADTVTIRWGEENTFPITLYATDGTEREEAPTLADGDCTLSKDGTESAPTLTWTDTGNMTKVTLSATDSELTHGMLSCEDASDPDAYFAFDVRLEGTLGAPDDTAQGGAASSITLASGASGSNDAYNRFLIVVVDGPGLPKTNCITDYVGSTNVATVEDAWAEQPTSSTKYVLVPADCGPQTLIANAVGDDEWNVTETVTANVTQIDGNATNGNNATLYLKQLNIQNSAGDAVYAASTGGNGDGAQFVGNGTGHGVNADAGATGIGLSATGGSTSGSGAEFAGQGGNSDGLKASGAGTGDGVHGYGGSGGGDGINGIGQGVGNGLYGVGGGTNAEGIKGDGGGSAGFGMQLNAAVGGRGLSIAGGTLEGVYVSSNSDEAVQFVSGGNFAGLSIEGSGTEPGLTVAGGGTSGEGVLVTAGAGNAPAIKAVATGTGAALELDASAGGQGLLASAGGNNAAIQADGAGSGAGVQYTGGATGNGAELVGGSTSGNALDLAVTSGNEIDYGGQAGVDVGSWLGTAVTLSSTSSKPEVDLYSLSDSTTAANNLEDNAEVIVTGTVDTGSFTPTTTQFEADDITEATDNHFLGRVVIFHSGALAGQAATITAYQKVGSNGRFTVDALTEAPGNNDTFVVN